MATMAAQAPYPGVGGRGVVRPGDQLGQLGAQRDQGPPRLGNLTLERIDAFHGGVVRAGEHGILQLGDRVPQRTLHLGGSLDEARPQGGKDAAGEVVECRLGFGEAFGHSVEDARSTGLRGEHDAPVERIYALKREIAEARRALVPLGAELPELVTGPDDTAPADAWVRRLVSAVDRLDRRFDAHDDLLADMLSAHLALISVRQNDTIRRISAWAAIVAMPTLIASIYGMNFRHMPELSWIWGYPAAAAVMVGVSLVLYRLFRRSGWL